MGYYLVGCKTSTATTTPIKQLEAMLVRSLAQDNLGTFARLRTVAAGQGMYTH